MARAGLAGLVVLCAAPFAAGAAEAGASVAERVFFDRLGALMEARRWGDAVRHIQQAQALRPVPAWFTEREGDVRLAQVRIGLAQRDLPAAVKAARLYLNGDAARSQRILDLAREADQAGHRPVAVALAKEIADRSPDFVAAQQALAAWEPKRAQKAPAQPKPKAGSEEDEAALLAQVRRAHAADEVSAMLAAARLFLNGDPARAAQLLAVAREFFSAGDQAAAIRVTREIVRRAPDFAAAERQLAEWEAGKK
jgi:hypothetical protein